MIRTISLLIVEDEEAIRDMLRFSLPAAEFTLRDVETVAQAIRSLSENIPDLIVLDWMLPDKSGLDFITWIKQKESLKDIPIIMLTAKAEEAQKIQGLSVGADDYVTKPFSVAELRARIKAVLRRGLLASPENEITVGALTLNADRHEARAHGQVLPLSPLEYKLLHFFVTHPDKTYSRDQLLNHVWGADVYVDERTVDVQIKRLRAKLKPFANQNLIQTVRGSGYIFTRGNDDEKTF
jgi:two-component system, OmpR family, phosphate regulon response regulator PhoB